MLAGTGRGTKMGREVCSPLLFATLFCCAVLLLSGTDYQIYYESGGKMLEYLLTPATICLAIPLYRQFALMRKHAGAVLAGCLAGVAAHMAGCAAMLVLPHPPVDGPGQLKGSGGQQQAEEGGGGEKITHGSFPPFCGSSTGTAGP